MLLTIVALLFGSALGKLRGGSPRAALATPIRGKGFLVVGIGATMVLTLLSPGQAMFWHLVSVIGFFGFAFANLAFTGMIVLTFGMLMNLAPLLANGAVPVSELALESVGSVDGSGEPMIDGVRESTDSASRLAALGDIVPVPLANKVVSLGDLVIYVALADIVMNLALRHRRESDEERFDFDSDDSDDDDVVIDLRDDPAPDKRRGPAHSAGHFRLTPPLPRVRRPSHAADPVEVDTASMPLDGFVDEQPPPPTGTPILAPPPVGNRHHRTARRADRPAPPTIDLSEESAELGESVDEVIASGSRDDLRSDLDLTDRRPIIDLTVSPSDEQLAEFLRRRSIADEQQAMEKLAPPSPGHRRNRTRRRQSRSQLSF